jgi:N4-gp56 family major capsid protein
MIYQSERILTKCDTLIAAELSSCATEQYANCKDLTAIATSDVLTGAEIRRAVMTLKKNKAKLFPDNYFKSIIPVTSVYDLRGNSEWLDAYRYTDATVIRNGEIGTLHGVRFYETNNEVIDAGAGAGGADLYSTFVFGMNAYGIINLEGQPGSRIIIKQSGPQDTSNPLDMYSTIGWKAYFVAKCLNSDWIIEIIAGSQGPC